MYSFLSSRSSHLFGNFVFIHFFVFCSPILTYPLRTGTDKLHCIRSGHCNTPTLVRPLQKKKLDFAWFKSLSEMCANTRRPRRHFHRVQSILQIAEDETYDSLRLINVELNRIFGRPDTMFLRTTPKQFLFDGVPFCVNVIGIAKAICKEIEKRNTKTIRTMPDGSLRFSFFSHVGCGDGLWNSFVDV